MQATFTQSDLLGQFCSRNATKARFLLSYIFRRRWRKISPPKNFLSCSLAPSTEGHAEVGNIQRLKGQDKFLQQRMSLKIKRHFC